MGKITDYFEKKKEERDLRRELEENRDICRNAVADGRYGTHQKTGNGSVTTEISAPSGLISVSTVRTGGEFEATTIKGIIPDKNGEEYYTEATRMLDDKGGVSYSVRTLYADGSVETCNVAKYQLDGADQETRAEFAAGQATFEHASVVAQNLSTFDLGISAEMGDEGM